MPGAVLGFYQGGCPIHLKGAQEVERLRRQGGGVWGGSCASAISKYQNIKMVSFYAFPVIFIDTVLSKKGTLIERAGVRTPPGSAPCITDIEKCFTSH